MDEDGSDVDLLTVYRYLYDDAQQVRRFLQFAVAAELVLFGAMPWRYPFVLMSAVQVLVCVFALFVAYTLIRPSVAAYRDAIERFAVEDTPTISESSANETPEESIELLKALNSRGERLVFVSLFVPGLYLSLLYMNSVVNGNLELPTSQFRINMIRLTVIVMSMAITGLSWWAQRAMIRDSLEISSDASYAGDRLILFVRRRRERVLSLFTKLPSFIVETVILIIGFSMVAFGLREIWLDGAISLLPFVAVGLLAILPVRCLVNRKFGVSIDKVQAVTMVIWVLASWYAILAINSTASSIGPRGFLLWSLTTVIPVTIVQYLQDRYTWI